MNTVTGACAQGASCPTDVLSSTAELNSIAKLRSRLGQIGDSASELTKLSVGSELTIREHCDSIRQQLDIAREIAIVNFHKASNKLMVEIDAYERKCLSDWTTAKESAEVTVKDVSMRMRAFLDEQLAFLQTVQASDDDVALHLDAADKLALELSDRKMQLKAAMFGNKLASFHAFPSLADVSLGELSFAHIQLPFKKLDLYTDELEAVEIRADFDFLLPLEHGQRIVAFKLHYKSEDSEEVTQMSCFDRLGRLIGSQYLDHLVQRGNVAQCGPSEFVVCHYSDSPELSVYDSDLKCLRNTGCMNYSAICCNSKFVFGLWDWGDRHDYYYEPDDDDDDSDEQQAQYSRQRIQVLHLDTLNDAFGLRVPAKYTIERIMADERHVVVISRLACEPSRQWIMTLFDLATCNESASGDKTARKFFVAERHVPLAIKSVSLSSVFLFEGWLVVPRKSMNKFVWFDKKGQQSETSTKWDSQYLKKIYSFGSDLLFSTHDGKLLLKGKET